MALSVLQVRRDIIKITYMLILYQCMDIISGKSVATRGWDIQRGIPIQESQEATGDVESDIYPDHSQLGTAVIICNVNFETAAPRRVAKLDIDRLCVVLREIGFHVDTPHVDKTDVEMVKILQDGEYGVYQMNITASGGGIIFGEWSN